VVEADLSGKNATFGTPKVAAEEVAAADRVVTL
jgi:hypothetical protein